MAMTLDAILAKGKKIFLILVLWKPYPGRLNFLMDSDKASEKLLHKIDSICSQIRDFINGRLDCV